MATAAIEARGLAVRYGDLAAADGASRGRAGRGRRAPGRTAQGKTTCVETLLGYQAPECRDGEGARLRPRRGPPPHRGAGPRSDAPSTAACGRRSPRARRSDCSRATTATRQHLLGLLDLDACAATPWRRLSAASSSASASRSRSSHDPRPSSSTSRPRHGAEWPPRRSARSSPRRGPAVSRSCCAPTTSPTSRRSATPR